MLYIQKEKRKRLLIIGFIGMALFAIGDVLLQSFSNDGDTLLIIMKTTVRDMPIGRLYFTLLTGIIAAPSMYSGLCAMDSYLCDRLKNRKEENLIRFNLVALKRQLHFLRYYPMDIISIPFFKVWHWCWRKRKGYL